ncbi:MAG: hypothetical protein WAO74_01190 [Polaribacter sp.]|uniref:hypothetical protein n=1 Tax=Polaribacter sp. TaxID=1920175 RepID=UPI003BAF813F
MKNFYKFLFLLFLIFLLSSNSAQPGVWNAGGSGSFTLLYPEDTVAYKKIQMKSEDIFIQLYKGFATVKGNYYFKNTGKDTLKIKVGYPINNVFENINYNEYVNQVSVDGLYKIKGLLNSKEIPIYEKPNNQNSNWYVWEITFPPNKITEFTVYFLVNTNNSKILEGYNSENKNAFIYLIETGSIWKSPIEKGNFYTQLKDHISIDNAKVSSPSTLFFDDDKSTLKFSLSDYGKKPDANFIITYEEKLENFDFKKITEKSDFYFKEMDNFSNSNFNSFSFSEIEIPSAYKVGGIDNSAINFVFYLTIYGIPILVGILALMIILLLYKKLKPKK